MPRWLHAARRKNAHQPSSETVQGQQNRFRDLRPKRALKASLGTEDGQWKGPVEEGVVWLVHSVQRPLELLVQSSMLSEQRPLVS